MHVELHGITFNQNINLCEGIILSLCHNEKYLTKLRLSLRHSVLTLLRFLGQYFPIMYQIVIMKGTSLSFVNALTNCDLQ